MTAPRPGLVGTETVALIVHKWPSPGPGYVIRTPRWITDHPTHSLYELSPQENTRIIEILIVPECQNRFRSRSGLCRHYLHCLNSNGNGSELLYLFLVVLYSAIFKGTKKSRTIEMKYTYTFILDNLRYITERDFVKS